MALNCGVALTWTVLCLSTQHKRETIVKYTQTFGIVKVENRAATPTESISLFGAI
jgi:hypothetical protein